MQRTGIRRKKKREAQRLVTHFTPSLSSPNPLSFDSNCDREERVIIDIDVKLSIRHKEGFDCLINKYYFNVSFTTIFSYEK